MRILIATSHFFAPIYRRAGMHQFALALAASGHHVDFITVGQSRLKEFVKPEIRGLIASADEAARTGANPANIHAHVHREAYHPPSGSPRLNLLTKPLIAFYGRTLDKGFSGAASAADIIILECGYPLFFFDTLKSLNPAATFVAFYNDRLELVGFRPEVGALSDRVLPRFDLVRTNAERLLDFLPAGAKGVYVPQGVDKERMSFDCPSPFAPGTKNLVSVGDTLFDQVAVAAIARAAASRGATVHVIGATMDDPPANVVLHGTMAFEKTLPYLVHADVGIAPYRPVDGADYLAQSSLKIQQYTYCGLPVLLPRSLGMTEENIVAYDTESEAGVDAAVEGALSTPRMPHLRERILGWDEVGERLIRVIAEHAGRHPRHGGGSLPHAT